MIDVRFVLHDTMSGITDASATVSPSRPITLQRESVTASGLPARPIRAVPHTCQVVLVVRRMKSASSASDSITSAGGATIRSTNGAISAECITSQHSRAPSISRRRSSASSA